MSSPNKSTIENKKPMVIPSAPLAANPMLYAALMKLRFEVIAAYPGSHLDVGKVIDYDYGKTTYDAHNNFEKFPAIFKQLEWWEKREWSEMPNYLKYKTSQYSEVEYVVYPCKFSKEGQGWTCHVEKSIIPHGNYLNDKLPATEAEYLSYQQYLEGKHK